MLAFNTVKMSKGFIIIKLNSWIEVDLININNHSPIWSLKVMVDGYFV